MHWISQSCNDVNTATIVNYFNRAIFVERIVSKKNETIDSKEAFLNQLSMKYESLSAKYTTFND